MTPSIDRLPELVAALPDSARHIFNRIFYLDSACGELRPPPHMLPWIEGQFGSIEKVKRQAIVRLTNKVTAESSIFNPLRSLRPHQFKGNAAAGPQIEGDFFADPLENTPEDVFGRVEGKCCVTAANIAKADQFHGIVIFNNAEPWSFGCNEVADYLETGWRWMQQAHLQDKEARYGLFLWNCTNRGGASIRHGHAQVMLGKGRHYGKVEQLHAAAEGYKREHKSDYFEDLYVAHEALGLAWRWGEVRIMAYLAALKQNEVMLLGGNLDISFKHAVYGVLEGLRDKLDVKSFNLGLAFPPLGDVTGWQGFPLVARIVDRGDTADLSSDLSAMEFYGASVVTSDPFHTADVLNTGNSLV